MKKVIIENSVNVDVLINKIKNEIEFESEFEYDYFKEVIIKNGSGIYEFKFISNEIDKFIKNDEYMSLDEFVDEELDYNNIEKSDYNRKKCMENLSEFYYDGDDFVFVLRNENFVKCVSYNEEYFSVFVNVVV